MKLLPTFYFKGKKKCFDTKCNDDFRNKRIKGNSKPVCRQALKLWPSAVRQRWGPTQVEDAYLNNLHISNPNA